MPRKNTDIEYDNRIEAITRQIIEGKTSRHALLQFITERYELSESQADKDIAQARSIIREAKSSELDNEISEAIFRLKNWIGRALESGNIREARLCQSEICKILGLYNAEKFEHVFNELPSTNIIISGSAKSLQQKQRNNNDE